MYQVAAIGSPSGGGGVYWVGGNDRRLSLFEGVYAIPRGVSYNSYLVLDEKTVLLDTVDKAVSGVFFENITHVLKGRSLDYLIVNHMEPDHASAIAEIVRRYSAVTIVASAMAKKMIAQFFDDEVARRVKVVGEGETLSTGRHTFTFMMAPMVHWPEVMVTYDATDKTLYSADAFGTFGALSGNLYADEVNFERDWLDDARRYYANIVGKYGAQVAALLEKAAGLEIKMLCPLHGPIWRRNIGWFMDKYAAWAAYTPETDGVVIAYNSVYGHTENAVNILAGLLAERGVTGIKVYDVSVADSSEIVAECWRVKNLVFAATTYNANIFVRMEAVLLDIKEHCLKNRTIALIENGSWAPAAGSLMRGVLGSLEGMNFIDAEGGDALTITSSPKEETRVLLALLADKIAASAGAVKKAQGAAQTPAAAGGIDAAAFHKFTYGLFVLTTKNGNKDNGCIVNTAMQLTDNPKRVSVAVNKANYTNALIAESGVFNISLLDTNAEFSLFKRFGFQSGKDVNKFDGFSECARSANGLYYINKAAAAFISAKVVDKKDYGTHTLFIGEVTEAAVLSGAPSLSYQYYFDNIKPKPQSTAGAQKKKGWVCKICGYFHEGEELPSDFVCPLCKHPASDFEKVGF